MPEQTSIEGSPNTAVHAPIVLFDGVCNLCNSSINWIIDRDPRARLRFAALQSAATQRLRQDYELPAELSTVCLIHKGRVHTRTSAALRIAAMLKAPWPLLSIFLIVPKFLRDPFYNLVAHYRYRWFGKQEACRMPTPELQARFLPGANELVEEAKV